MSEIKLQCKCGQVQGLVRNFSVGRSTRAVCHCADCQTYARHLDERSDNCGGTLDEFGGTVGLVTLEDILTDVLGGLRREGSGEKFVMEQIGDGQWRLSGNVWLEDFRREYPQLQRAVGVDTIGGLVASKSDMIPPVGTEVSFSGLNLKVTEADGRRVLEVIAQKAGRAR